MKYSWHHFRGVFFSQKQSKYLCKHGPVDFPCFELWPARPRDLKPLDFYASGHPTAVNDVE